MSAMATGVWERIPDPARGAAKRAWAGYALLTSRGRLLPDFLIIGTQRGGTTSLWKYLAQNPALGRALTKEIRFFDLNWHRGVSWYRSRFPSRRSAQQVARRRGVTMVVGEASPDYLFHPLAPSRVAGTLPDVKLVVLLRNPVDRAYSHYWHQVKRGHERLSFEDAIDRERERLAGERDRVVADPRYVSYELHHHSYLTRGMYADQLEKWMGRFRPEQFLIERSEDLFAEPREVFRRVLGYLGLPPRDLPRYETFNAHTEEPIQPEIRKRLVEHFRPHNHRLHELLGRDMGWDE